MYNKRLRRFEIVAYTPLSAVYSNETRDTTFSAIYGRRAVPGEGGFEV